jgi:hypothetical protein
MYLTTSARAPTRKLTGKQYGGLRVFLDAKCSKFRGRNATNPLNFVTLDSLKPVVSGFSTVVFSFMGAYDNTILSKQHGSSTKTAHSLTEKTQKGKTTSKAMLSHLSDNAHCLHSDFNN